MDVRAVPKLAEDPHWLGGEVAVSRNVRVAVKVYGGVPPVQAIFAEVH